MLIFKLKYNVHYKIIHRKIRSVNIIKYIYIYTEFKM